MLIVQNADGFVIFSNLTSMKTPLFWPREVYLRENIIQHILSICCTLFSSLVSIAECSFCVFADYRSGILVVGQLSVAESVHSSSLWGVYGTGSYSSEHDWLGRRLYLWMPVLLVEFNTILVDACHLWTMIRSCSIYFASEKFCTLAFCALSMFYIPCCVLMEVFVDITIYNQNSQGGLKDHVKPYRNSSSTRRFGQRSIFQWAAGKSTQGFILKFQIFAKWNVSFPGLTHQFTPL